MTDEQYKATQMKMIKLAVQIDKLDLEGYLGRISTVETTGPILDPTNYRDAMGNIRGLKRLAEKMLSVKASVLQFRESVLMTAIHQFEKDAQT